LWTYKGTIFPLIASTSAAAFFLVFETTGTSRLIAHGALALVLVQAIVLFFLVVDEEKTMCAAAACGHYLTYDTVDNRAPGIWSAASPLRRRRRVFLAYLIVASTAFFGNAIRQTAIKDNKRREIAELLQQTQPAEPLSGALSDQANQRV